MQKKVAVIMGSDSDWPVVKNACAQLAELNIPYEAHILSAHRTPAAAAEFAAGARQRGFGVIICAAGMAAHLAGAFAFPFVGDRCSAFLSCDIYYAFGVCCTPHGSSEEVFVHFDGVS